MRRLFVCLLCLAPMLPAQTTWFVDASSAGPGTGAMTDPFPTIGAAITASSSGDQIEIASGTYGEAIDLLGKTLVLRGANVATTTIDGSGQLGPTVTVAGGEGLGTTLENLRIIGGSFGTLFGRGGGVHVEASNLLMRQCLVAGNTGGQVQAIFFTSVAAGAGGLTVVNGANVQLEATRVDINLWRGSGSSVGAGGVLVADATLLMEGGSIDDNTSGDLSGVDGFIDGGAGGLEVQGVSSVTLRGVRMRDNTGGIPASSQSAPAGIGDGGPGAVAVRGGQVVLERCDIRENDGGNGADGVDTLNQPIGTDAGPGGSGGPGAILVRDPGALSITTSFVTGNRAGNGGNGGVAPISTVFGFQGRGGTGGSGGAGAIYNRNAGLRLVGSTVAGNVRGVAGTGGIGFMSVMAANGVDGRAALVTAPFGALAETMFANCIFENANGPEIAEIQPGLAVTSGASSIVSGGFPGARIFNFPARFLDPVAGDYRLASDSPAIDRADPTIPGIGTLDIDGDPRSRGLGPDIGADEETSFVLFGSSQGMGIGDLELNITGIPPQATNVVLIASYLPAPGGLGTGPFLGVYPDAVTWVLITFPVTAGNPFHFPVTASPYAAGPLRFPPGSVSALAGITVEAAALAYGFPISDFARLSNHATWTY